MESRFVDGVVCSPVAAASIHKGLSGRRSTMAKKKAAKKTAKKATKKAAKKK